MNEKPVKSIVILVSLILIFIFTWVLPVRSARINILSILLIIIILGQLIFIFRSKKIVLFCLIGLPIVIVIVFLFTGGGSIDTNLLREKYVQALHRYDGTNYVWGGETAAGIDCSGLVRAGMIDALRETGIDTFNPMYFRKTFDYWLEDTSAEALGEEYKGLTVQISEKESINTIDYSLLIKGDIAVTQDGTHTMVYIGEKRWIQADPYKGKVIIEAAPSSTNHYYDVDMRIMRWTILTKGKITDGADQYKQPK